MNKVKILNKEYGTNSAIAAWPDEASPPDEFTPPFTYTARKYVGLPTDKPYPYNMNNYYFRCWTIGSEIQTDPTLEKKSVLTDVTATAWYTIFIPREVGPTAIYGRAFNTSSGEFLEESPFGTADPASEVTSEDSTRRTVITANSNVKVTAKASAQSGILVFKGWATLQPALTVHATGESAPVMIEGPSVTVRKGTTVDLIAKYSGRPEDAHPPPRRPKPPDERTRPHPPVP